MEFPKLIQKGKSKGKSSLKTTKKKVWQIKTKIDNSKNEIVLITESGDLGGRLITRQKKISNINLSSKKGISSLEKYAEEEAKKVFNRKKKEGYIEMPVDSKEIIDNEDYKDNEEVEEKDKEKENVNIRQKIEKKKVEQKNIPNKTYYPMLAHQFNQKKK